MTLGLLTTALAFVATPVQADCNPLLTACAGANVYNCSSLCVVATGGVSFPTQLGGEGTLSGSTDTGFPLADACTVPIGEDQCSLLARYNPCQIVGAVMTEVFGPNWGQCGAGDTEVVCGAVTVEAVANVGPGWVAHATNCPPGL